MKQTLLLLFLITVLGSCTEKYNEDVLTVAGNYEAILQGVGGPFLITVSVDHGSNILIDAPFDGVFWYLAEAKLRKEEENLKEIKIPDQEIAEGIYIEGDGVFFDYTIQLDYSIDIDGDIYDYTLVGSKL